MSGAAISGGGATDLGTLLTLLASPEQTKQRVLELKAAQDQHDAAAKLAARATREANEAHAKLERELADFNADVDRHQNNIAAFERSKRSTLDHLASREKTLNEGQRKLAEDDNRLHNDVAEFDAEVKAHQEAHDERQKNLDKREAKLAVQEDRLKQRKAALEAALAEG